MRTGDMNSADEASSLMKSILCRLPLIEGRTFRFRDEATFFSHKLMDLFEKRNSPVLYAIRAKGTGILNEACIAHYSLQVNLEDSSYSQSTPFCGEIRYRKT